MEGQYSEYAAIWARKMYGSVCLITGDTVCSEKLVLETLLQGRSLWLSTEDIHTVQVALYKRLIRRCFLIPAKHGGHSIAACFVLKGLGRFRRTAVVLSCFVGFNQADAAFILGIPRALYAILLKKSLNQLMRLQEL